MRINRFELTAYGKFSGRVLHLPKPADGAPDLHIIYGENEAGKSTLMSGWLDLLFGMPLQSPYNFIHDYTAMEVGAEVEHAGRLQTIRRIKKKTGSLLDGHGAVLPDSALGNLTGPLTREGYQQMFSLDDDTIEQGGRHILESKGELGEMLFSASAGLAGLSGRLDDIRKGYEGFYKERARSGGLYEAKKTLDGLAAQQQKLDVTVSALRKMQGARTTAERALARVVEARAAAQTRLRKLEKLQDALPQRARLREMEARYRPLASTFHATDHHLQTLQALRAAAAAKRDDLARIGTDLARRQALIVLQQVDAQDDIIAAGPMIDAAQALQSAHDEALKDLDRRKDERASVAQTIARHMVALDANGQEVQAVLVPAPRLAQMWDLLQRRSGLEQARELTAAEAARALRTRDAALAEGAAPAGLDESVLANLLAEINAAAPLDGLRRARVDLAQAQEQWTAAVTALAPWTGDAASLAAMALPHADDLAEMSRLHDAARQASDDARRDLSYLEQELTRAEATAPTVATGAIGLQDAAAARMRREGLWAAHRNALTLESAAAFEEAMRADDQMTALLAEALAESRRTTLALAALDRLRRDVDTARLAVTTAQIAEAQLAEDFAVKMANYNLTGFSLSAFTSWLQQREIALRAMTALRQAEATYQLAAHEVHHAAILLAEAMSRPLADLAVLIADAKQRVDAAQRLADRRQQLSGLEADLVERNRLATEAAQSFATWQAAWSEATTDTALADGRGDAGTLLETLTALGHDHDRQADLDHRIASMEENRDAFLQAVDGVRAQLRLPAHVAWSEIAAKRTNADMALRNIAREKEECTRVLLQQAEAQATLAALQAEEQVLADLSGWDAAQGGDLANHLKTCIDAMSLRSNINILRADLAALPQDDQDLDGAELTVQVSQAQADLASVEEAYTAAIDALTIARRDLDALGGDDQLTRLAAERESLLLDLRERAQDYLRQRLSLMTFEAGLRRYRDLHQSAMLSHASRAFTRLTHGAYNALVARPQGAKDILTAQTADGRMKEATHLSKGARFQLYLALRVAGYHELAQSRPMVPFIADDILETFDDARAGAAFELLGEMAQRGQVIYLTHHRHLCDIAQAHCPTAQMTIL